jgi:ABC-type phosphate/phosphonate transport system substrate-binding protein
MHKKYGIAACIIMVFYFLIPGLCRAKEKTICIAFSNSTISDVNLKDAKLAMEIWSKSLAKKMGFEYKTEVRFYKDIETLHSAVRNGEVDFVQLDSYDYLKWKYRDLVEPIMCGEKSNTPLEKFYIIVHKDSGIRSLAGLKNKKIIIERGNKAGIPQIWFDYELLKARLPVARKYCASLILEDNPSRSVIPIYFRQADACVVTDRAYNTITELNPSFSNKITIITESPGFIIGFICVRKDCDENMRRAFIESGISLEKETEGRQMLTLFRLDRVAPYKPSYILNMERLTREYDALTRQK